MVMDPNRNELSDFIRDFRVDDETLVSSANQDSTNVENGFKFSIPSPDFNFLNIPFNPLNPDPGTTTSPDLDSLGVSSSLSPDGSLFTQSLGWSPEGEASSPSDDSDSSDPVLKYISQMLMEEKSPKGEAEAEASSPSGDSDSSDPVLKYISQMLMEEKMEEKPCMFYDSSALQATERSFYEILGEQQPHNSAILNQNQTFFNLNTEGRENNNKFFTDSSDFNCNSGAISSTSSGGSDFVDTLLVGDAGEFNGSFSHNPLPNDYHFNPNSLQQSSQFSVNSQESMTNIGNGLLSSVNEFLAQNMLSDRESALQFKKGMEEACKFLPTGNQLIIDLESYGFSTEQKEDSSKVVVKVEKEEMKNSPERSRGIKNHQREDVVLEEERSTKQSALYKEESELSDMFDKVLLLHVDSNGNPVCTGNDQGGKSNGSSGRSHSRKQGKRKDTVDLRTLLILCAQAVSSNDCRTANELLKQIRQHSSPTGDGSQRLAHWFANGLEARLFGSGTGTKSFLMSLAPRRSAADMLKAYKVYLSACPFKKLTIMFTNKMIMKVSEKATTLHIVDFGIRYGFQWPVLIQLLSMRPGGPPKLRITGIELPQPGFRPAESIDETGRRLAKYCQRFNVPFEYNSIASQYWETIQFEDMKINPDEVLAVNSFFRFKNLLDETVEVNCPRNAVLKLIRKIKPNIFVHSIVNGSYNAPFFVTRFREAIFHFSSLFDMFDTTMPREDPERLMFEREVYGREAMNVIACEGLDRVERPETYEQWQVRIMRAGFKQLPLDKEVMEKLSAKLNSWYHKDFIIDRSRQQLDASGMEGKNCLCFLLLGTCAGFMRRYDVLPGPVRQG